MTKKRMKIKRPHHIKVSLSDEEVKKLDESRGEQLRAVYLRELGCSQKAARKVNVLKVDPDLLRALNKIGGNLNQLSYFINRLDDHHLIEKVEALVNLNDIRLALERLK
ncbi:hypothetical protein [Acinetobacter sp. HY1485]|uniref:hypothetical protein n=1 Tax=Acinetobacter sp. HY1485 TaxID=2970918 RepID=UPI0022B9A4C3|nr:hypothetical protein [Acinetobacter sp. HY1485]